MNYFKGGKSEKGSVDTILKLNTTLKYNKFGYIMKIKDSWTQVGKLKQPRRNHGVSVVNKEDVEEFCL